MDRRQLWVWRALLLYLDCGCWELNCASQICYVESPYTHHGGPWRWSLGRYLGLNEVRRVGPGPMGLVTSSRKRHPVSLSLSISPSLPPSPLPRHPVSSQRQPPVTQGNVLPRSPSKQHLYLGLSSLQDGERLASPPLFKPLCPWFVVTTARAD